MKKTKLNSRQNKWVSVWIDLIMSFVIQFNSIAPRLDH